MRGLLKEGTNYSNVASNQHKKKEKAELCKYNFNYIRFKGSDTLYLHVKLFNKKKVVFTILEE